MRASVPGGNLAIVHSAFMRFRPIVLSYPRAQCNTTFENKFATPYCWGAIVWYRLITDEAKEGEMKIRIILSNLGGEMDRQTIEAREPEHGAERTSIDIIQALKAWTLAPGDTITIQEVGYKS